LPRTTNKLVALPRLHQDCQWQLHPAPHQGGCVRADWITRTGSPDYNPGEDPDWGQALWTRVNMPVSLFQPYTRLRKTTPKGC